MMRVLRIDENLGALDMPPVNLAHEIIMGPEDALVVCAGFEDRSLGALQALTPSPQRRVVLVEYLPLLLGNRLEGCLQECRRLGTTPIRYTYDRENPAGAGGDIYSLIPKVAGRLYLDVSGMSRLLIVQLLEVFIATQSFPRITILYTEPNRYYPLPEQFAAIPSKSTPASVEFLSWGVSEITVVPELSSVALLDQPTHLIVFPSFDRQQLTAVRKDIEPARISMIFGFPLPEHGEWRLGAVREINQQSPKKSVDEFVTSTYDYRETVSLLLRLYSLGERLEKVVISPTGSKMQTVAVGIVRAFLGDVKVVYPTPRSFAPRAYTDGIRRIHRLDLDVFVSMERVLKAPSVDGAVC